MVKSVYIHIPFCSTICSYCDFCKLFYYPKYVEKYLKILEAEIKEGYHGEILDTIYVGGGTPTVLSLEELENLLQILSSFSISEEVEYTFECNVETLTYEKLNLLKKYGVNRLSVGVQTFDSELLKILERHHTKKDVFEKIEWMKELGFENINVDLMYALPSETISQVQKDLDFFLSLDIPHISTYSLILEPNTKLWVQKVKPLDEDLDYEMYSLIEHTLEGHDYIHYETSNYAKKGFASKHNLTYWNNLEYYAFGVGSSGYLNGIRFEHTRSLTEYLKGNFLLESHSLSKLEDMQNSMILGLRKTEGVSLKEFQKRFGVSIEETFPISSLLEEGKLVLEKGFYKIPKEYIYLANEILIFFL